MHYAVTHEYAQTATDVLARRTRLAFLNVHAALEALPRVVDIMAAELGWTRAERVQEIERAVRFLGAMGLVGGVVMPKPLPRGWGEKMWAWVGAWAGGGRGGHVGEAGYVHSRARFEPGELAALVAVFGRHAVVVQREAEGERADGEAVRVVALAELEGAVREVAGYEGVSGKDFEYVLEEAGLRGVLGVDFDEFVEVCGNLKEVALLPVQKNKKRERLRIPVEKSGGGV